ncbi:hypothetical protein SteCoe_2351 [Stentor coeruleus]|uniref:Uncharacterized protein n=1 Tax=Stentor coeruleus TaxID=5963 RepID=A0A1R2CZQ1_9CILI|nr:hypothetical protein SteCoe_2351 [Stentor coeruleus]
MDLIESLNDSLGSEYHEASANKLTEIEEESLRFIYYLETNRTLDDDTESLSQLAIPITTDLKIKSRKGIIYKKYLGSLKNFQFISKRQNQFIETNKVKCPKKEYIRTKLIRGHKRAQRQCFQKLKPDKTIHRIDENNKHQIKSWEDFKNNVIAFADIVKEMSKTENGPLTDGKTKRILDAINKNAPKTCNDEFVKDYFKSTYMRESFRLYINVIFAKQKPKELCERFGFNCCNRKNHFARCKEVWAMLYEQLRNEFIDIHVDEI